MIIEPAIDAKATGRRLLRLVKDCDEFSLASAWVTRNPVFDAALLARKKMRHFVIGTSGYITDADCLAKCFGKPGVEVFAPHAIPMFHPKLYVFELGGSREVYVGSANLTRRGLSENTECGVFLRGARTEPTLGVYFEYIKDQHRLAKAQRELLGADFVANYRETKLRLKAAQHALEKFVRWRSRGNKPRGVARLEWAQFEKRLLDKGKGSLPMRLKLLERARARLAQASFAQLPPMERRALAGVLHGEWMGIQWGYFGRMRRCHLFAEAVENEAGRLSRALSIIPREGEVTQAQYERYVTTLLTVPGATEGWIATGTRLLAIKRPDVFVCIDSRNRDGLCADLGCAPTQTNLGNYWERIIQPLQSTPWWNAPAPLDPKVSDIWRSRAALLDVLYYEE